MSEQTKKVFWVYLAVAALVVGWIGVRTQMTANQQERQAAETMQFSQATQSCLRELVDTLRARTALTAQSDKLNNEQHEVLANLLQNIAAAPPERWEAIVAKGLPIVVEAQQRQERLLDERNEHPIPDPTCPVVGR